MFHQSKIAICTDLHLGLKNNSIEFHKIALDWARWFKSELEQKNIKDIVFCGDFFDSRSEIGVNTLHVASDILNLWKNFNIVMITGNHCCYQKLNSDIHSLSILSGWSNITVLDKLTTITEFNKVISFNPWGSPIESIPSSDLIFGHFEIQTFKFNQYSICDHGLTAEDLFKKSPFIITGHFHLREYREYSNTGRVLYCGNPFQMDFGDVDSIKGYHILDLNTLLFEFFENTLSPKHFKINFSDLVRDGKLTEEVRNKFKNNFIKLYIDKNISADEADFLLKKLNELNPLSLAVEYSYSFDKFGIDQEKDIDLSGVDIPVAIEEFINLIESPYKKEVAEYTLNLFNKCK